MTTPKTAAPELVESQADKEETVNEAVRRVEAGAGLFRVEDNDATAPPGSCVDGAQYIPAATATGAWAGKEKNIAIAVGTNAANGWYFIAPEEGMRAWVKDENAEFSYDGSAWVAYTAPPTGGSYTDEMARDAIGTALTDTGLAVVTVNDGADTIDINVPAAAGADFRTGTDATKALTADAAWDAAAFVALTDGATVTPDFAAGLNFTWTIAGNRTLANPSSAKEGQTGVIQVTQDGTGSRTISAYGNQYRFAGGTDIVLSTAAGAIDLLFYVVLPGPLIFLSAQKAIAA
jgi:hypothetical protein